jgi:hypothetical protein
MENYFIDIISILWYYQDGLPSLILIHYLVVLLLAAVSCCLAPSPSPS